MKVLNLILKYKNALNFVGIILSIIYFIYLSLQISAKNSEIKTLKFDLEKAKFELFECDKNLKIQNKAIKELEIKGTPKEPPDVEKVKKIYIKDQSCVAELKAYRELFDEI